jgi:hypothetical protein
MFRVLSDLRSRSMRLESSLPRGFRLLVFQFRSFSVRSTESYVGLVRSVYCPTPMERPRGRRPLHLKSYPE